VTARVTLTVALVAMTLAVTGCKASSSTAGSSASSTTATLSGVTRVNLLDPDLVFSPSKVTVHLGKEVSWHWPGGAAHNVTFADFTSGTFTQGTFNHTFIETGTFRYECTLHSANGKGMIGRVVVVP
jgi:plastocyanin